MFYVYFHLRPNGVPFYVGKGLKRRATNLTRFRNQHHQNVVDKYGKDNIQVMMFPCASEEEALAKEVRSIERLRHLGLTLCNITDGGEGASGFKHSEEAKRRMSEQRKGMIISEAQRQAIRDANLGTKRSLETRLSLSTKALARDPVSDATKEKLSKALTGRGFSATTRSKLSEALKGKPKSEAAKQAMRKAWKTRAPITEETRAKMRAAALARKTNVTK